MVRLLEQHNNNNNLSWGSESELGSPVNLTPIIILLSKRRTITQTSNLSFYFCTREKFGFEEDDNRNSRTLVELFEHKNTFDSNITDVMLHPLWNGAIEFRTARKVIRSQLSHYFSSSSRPFFWLINKASKIKLLCYQAHDVCSTDQKNDHEDNCLCNTMNESYYKTIFGWFTLKCQLWHMWQMEYFMQLQ